MDSDQVSFNLSRGWLSGIFWSEKGVDKYAAQGAATEEDEKDKNSRQVHFPEQECQGHILRVLQCEYQQETQQNQQQDNLDFVGDRLF